MDPSRTRTSEAGASDYLPSPAAVAEPESAEELARVLAQAAAAGLAVVPRGGGTKLGWGNAPRAADLVLSTAKLDAVTAHAAADLTVTVQAGCTVARLQEVLARQNQRLAIDPGWPERATVGGILSTNDSGALRIAFGSLRDQLIGITVALADPAAGAGGVEATDVPGANAANAGTAATAAPGRLARSGGRVVKNVAGYDLPKLFVGSLGTLGVITEATFRLYPLPAATRTIVLGFEEFALATAFVLALHDSRLRPTGVQLQASRGAPPRVAVRLEGVSGASVEAQQRQLETLAAPAGGRAQAEDPAGPVWLARERLGAAGGPITRAEGAARTAPSTAGAVCKVTFLPARLAALVGDIAAAGAGWEVVAQSVGVGWLRLEAADVGSLIQAILQVRAAAAGRGGSLFVADAPEGVRRGLDVWGDPGDALALMRRVKAQFDPRGCLNPGRFVGGI